MNTDEPLMSTKQAAEYLAVDPWTVKRWVREGKVHAQRLPGGRFRFTTDDIKGLLTPA